MQRDNASHDEKLDLLGRAFLLKLMPEDKEKKPALTLGALGSAIKTWLPIILTIGSLVIGYVLFKAETKHQFELVSLEISSLKESVDNYNELNSKIQDLEKSNTIRDVYIKLLLQDARGRGVIIPEIDND